MAPNKSGVGFETFSTTNPVLVWREWTTHKSLTLHKDLTPEAPKQQILVCWTTHLGNKNAQIGSCPQKFGVKIKDILTCSVHPGKDVLIPPPKKKNWTSPTKHVSLRNHHERPTLPCIFKGLTCRTHNQHTQSMLKFTLHKNHIKLTIHIDKCSKHWVSACRDI